jgi:hypothetical protein
MAEVLVANKQTAYGAPSSIGHEKYVVTYDFSLDGGATADTYTLIEFKNACAVKLEALRVVTAGTSGGSATISLGIASGTEFLTTAAIAGFSLGAIVNQDTPGEYYKVEDDEKLVLSVGTAALTAGKFEMLFDVIQS